jgi:hypothetical protein
LESKKNRRDYGLILGKRLISTCGERSRRSRAVNIHGDEATPLLMGDERPSLGSDSEGATLSSKPLTSQTQTNGEETPTKHPSWSEIFSPQSNLALLAYSMLTLHSMAFDSLFPVFLHHPEQELEGNPNVHLPIKFAGGFGLGVFLSQ